MNDMNVIYGINGPVVTVKESHSFSMMEMVYVGNERLVGEVIGIVLNPDDIHIMHKSQYSGMFGDYSSYSAEYDEINDPDAVIGGEESPEEALNEE